MARPRITPTRAERPFRIDELFFSTTDLKGIIRSGNDVFARVSGYTEAELIGEPHNIIRHPDMPRAVFQLLWDYIQSDRPIAAYVKNLAKDGGYYWVLATVVGIDGGYLSVRLKPSAEILPVVETAYADLCKIERQIESSGGTPKQAIAASTEALVARLPALGFADYDAFMRHALPAELASRKAQLRRRTAARRPSHTRSAVAELLLVRDANRAVTDFLYGQFANRDSYTELLDAFTAKATFIREFSDDVQLFSLNALVASARLREFGAALGAVADQMRVRSNSAAETIHEMAREIDAMREIQETLVFDLSLATLQSEAIEQFVDELIERGEVAADEDAGSANMTSINIAALAARLRDGIAPMLEVLADLERRFARMAVAVSRLDRELRQLDALQVAGRVESAHLADAQGFRVLFEEIRDQIATATAELSTLRIGKDVLEQSRRSRGNEATERSLDHIERWASAVAAA